MQPIRGAVHTVVDFGDKEPEEYTMREAIEWWKKCARVGEIIGVPTQLEHKLLNERWAYLCKKLGEREGVPQGALSYFLGELAQSEIAALRLAEAANAEVQ